MIEELTAALRDPRPWLELFRRRSYEAAFRDYSRRFGPLYDQAAREAEDLPALAGAILDALEEDRRSRRPWARGALRVDEKQVLVAYLSPMLLEREEPRSRELCGVLREAWNSRWPRDAYQTAGFDQIRSGFRTAVMGIELRRTDREES